MNTAEQLQEAIDDLRNGTDSILRRLPPSSDAGDVRAPDRAR